MTEVISFTIARDLLKELDKKRGDTPRSKFISKILAKALELQLKRGENIIRITRRLQESEDIKRNRNICDGTGCNNDVTTSFPLNVDDFGIITLNLCAECLTKFDNHRGLIRDDEDV